MPNTAATVILAERLLAAVIRGDKQTFRIATRLARLDTEPAADERIDAVTVPRLRSLDAVEDTR